MRDGIETEEGDITVKALFQKFEDYCLPKKNLIVERRFFTRNQPHDETIDAYITQLRNFSSTCELGNAKDGLILYKLVDRIQSDKIWDTLLRKGSDLTLKKAKDVCRADETTNHEMKILKQEIDVDTAQRNRRSNNDNRGKMQHTARAPTSTTMNNQKKCKYCGKQHLPK